jgi:hypothetical protein
MATMTFSQRRGMNLAFAMGIVLLGLLLTVAVTESRVGERQGPNAALAVDDIAGALRGRGLEVTDTGQDIQQRMLDATGRELRVNGAAVEVYAYDTVAQRVAQEQRWNEQVMGLSTPQARDPLPRITSVHNVLLLIHSTDATLPMTITHAISDLIT